MTESIKQPFATFGGAAVYRITVQGTIPASWHERLAGMFVRIDKGREERDSKSVLEGILRDQSELSGVLDVLYHLHLPIVRIEQLDEAG